VSEGNASNSASVASGQAAAATSAASSAQASADLATSSNNGALAQVHDLAETVSSNQSAQASTNESLSAEIGGVSGTVSEQAGAIATIEGKVVTYWQVAEVTSDGTARLQLANSDGHTQFLIDAEDVLMSGNLLVSGTVTARVFQTDQGVGLAAVKYGELNTGASATQSGSATINLSNVTLCSTSGVDCGSGDTVFVSVKVTVAYTTGGPGNYLYIIRTVNGGSPVYVRELNNYNNGGAGNSTTTWDLTINDIAHGSGNIVYSLVAAASGGSYTYIVTGGQISVNRIFSK
jgi:hypothetical protein